MPQYCNITGCYIFSWSVKVENETDRQNDRQCITHCCLKEYNNNKYNTNWVTDYLFPIVLQFIITHVKNETVLSAFSCAFSILYCRWWRDWRWVWFVMCGRYIEALPCLNIACQMNDRLRESEKLSSSSFVALNTQILAYYRRQCLLVSIIYSDLYSSQNNDGM